MVSAAPTLAKAYAEEVAAMPTEFRGYQVKTMDMPAGIFVGIREKINMEKIAEFLGQSYGLIGGALQVAGVQPNGMPCALYYEWDEENGMTDMAAVMPVDNKINLGEAVDNIELPAGNAAIIDYYGDYSGIGEAHYAMDDFLKANQDDKNERSNSTRRNKATFKKSQDHD